MPIKINCKHIDIHCRCNKKPKTFIFRPLCVETDFSVICKIAERYSIPSPPPPKRIIKHGY